MRFAKARKCIAKVVGAVTLAAFVMVALGFVAAPQAQATQGFPLYSWGNPAGGRLGRVVDAANPNDLPARVGNRADWVLVVSAEGGSKGIDTQGRLWTWGPAGPQRGLGAAGMTNAITEPTQVGDGNVGDGNGWIHVSSLANVVVAINEDGHLYTWGQNNAGQLGRGGSVNVDTPTRLLTDPGCTTVFIDASVHTATGALTLALTYDGYIYSWGQRGGSQAHVNSLGRVVDAGNPADRPARVETPHNNWVRVEAGENVAMAICTQGYLYTWGNSLKIGRDVTAENPSNRPRRVANISNVVDVTMTIRVVAAVTKDGYLYTWGDILGTTGANEIGRAVNVSNPANRPGLVAGNSWTAVMGGWQHFIALTTQNEIYAWGVGSLGRLGLGGNSDENRPTLVGYIIHGVGAARGGGSHSLVLIGGFRLSPPQAELRLAKHLQKLEGTANPGASFTFNVARHSFDRDEALINRVPVIDPITLTPSAIGNPNAPNPAPEGITTRIHSGINIFDEVDFEEPGRFTYRISEVLGSSEINTPATNYDYPIRYSRAVYEVSVYIIENPVNTAELIVDAITVYRITSKTGATLNPPVEVVVVEEADNIIFTNTYFRIGTLSVSKTVAGYFADPEASFDFTVTMTATALFPDEPIVGRVMAGSTPVGDPITFTSGASTPVTLRHGQALVFDELVVGTGFTAAEQVPAGFAASVILHVNGAPVTVPPGTLTELSIGGPHLVGTGTNSAAFTNTHFDSPPMGLVIGNGSMYALFAVAAFMTGTLLVLKSRRRIEAVPIMSNFHYGTQSSTQRTRTINNTGEGEV